MVFGPPPKISLPCTILYSQNCLNDEKSFRRSYFVSTSFNVIFPLVLLLLNHFSHIQLLATPWTIACQAPLSIGFSRQEYWSGLTCPPPGDLPNSRIEPASLMSPALAGGSLSLVLPRKPLLIIVRKSIPHQKTIHWTINKNNCYKKVKEILK